MCQAWLGGILRRVSKVTRVKHGCDLWRWKASINRIESQKKKKVFWTRDSRFSDESERRRFWMLNRRFHQLLNEGRKSKVKKEEVEAKYLMWVTKMDYMFYVWVIHCLYRFTVLLTVINVIYKRSNGRLSYCE